MPRKYPQEVSEAVWVLLCDGHGPAAIRRALASGEATGTPVEVAERTLTNWISKLKLERGDPSHAVAPGRELEVARGIRRAALEMLGQQLERLRSKARAEGPNPLSSRELEALRKLAQTADEIANREAKLPPDPNATERGKAGAAARTSGTPSLLAGVAKARQQAADPAPEGAEP